MSVELIDELEAGELSVEFEGEEPETVLGWALERFSPSIAISTAFQIDGVALIDMAYEIDNEVRVFSVDTGRLPAESFELIERLRDRYPGLSLDLLSPNGDEISRMTDEARPEPLLRQGRPPAALLQHPQGPAADAAPRQAWTRGSRAFAATSGRAARTSARSRSTTTTARS